MADVGSLDSEQLLVLLQEIGKAADKIKTNVVGMGEASTKHMKNAGEAMAGVDKQIVSMTKNLLGPVGLAAGFFAVAKSLDSFAVGQLQLSNLAKNTGLAASSVLQLQTRFDVAGLGAEGFSKTIGGITSALNNIKTFQEQSDVFGKLSQLLDLKVDGQQIANTVLGFEKIGNRLGAINTLVKGWNQGTERQKLYIEELLHTDRAGMEALQQDIKNVVLVTQQGDAEARKYHATWVSIQNTGTNIWNTISNAALKEILAISGGLEGLKGKSESVTLAIKTYFETNVHPAIAREMETIKQLQSFIEYIGKLTEGRQFAPGKGPPGALTAEEFLKREREKGGIDSDQLPKGARPRSYSPDDVDKDSNKVLHDIRDMMQRSEIRQGGQGSASLTFRPGVGGGSLARRGSGGEMNVGSIMGGRSGGREGVGGEGEAGKGESKGGYAPNEGTLAEQRQRYIAELNADPKLKDIAIDAMKHEGGIQSNMEQLFNYANMRRMTVRQALYSGQFGPMTGRNRDPNMGNISAKTRAAGQVALDKVGAGSNITDYATDQGMAGDPNYDKYMANKDYYRMHKVEGAWFSYHGGQGRDWAARQRDEATKAASAARAYSGLSIDEGQRTSLDKSMRAGPHGTLDANVTFANVPPGVKTDAQGKGFKTLRVTASKQGQKAAEGLMSPGSMEYTPWVP